MDRKVINLLDVMDDEAKCYQEMKSVLADEQASLSLERNERFDQIQLQKEALMAELQRHEKKRKGLVDRLAEAYLPDGSNPTVILTISNLARHLPASDKADLLSRADRLRSCMLEVQSINKNNQQLIRHYRDLAGSALKLLAGLMDDDPVYQKPGSAYPGLGYGRNGGRIISGAA